MLSVLLVEDDEDLGSLLQELFAQVGWVVRVERNGRDALRSLKTARPDIVVTDGIMPHMGGRELLGSLRADPEFQDVPVILMSGADYLLKEDEADACRATVRKPFDPDQLVDLVLQLVRPSQRSAPLTSRRSPTF